MQTIQEAQAYESLQPYSKACQDAVGKLQKVLQYLQSYAAKGEVELYMADANLFMEYCGLVAVAWQWLKQAIVAEQALSKNELNEKQKDFYISKLETMKFYYKYELPKTEALAISMMHADKVTLKKEREIMM